MKSKRLLALAGFGLVFSSQGFTANEVEYDPESGRVVIPNVMIRGDLTPRYRVMLRRDSNNGNKFTLVFAEQKTNKIDRDVEKYLKIESGLYGQAIVTGEGDANYAENMQVSVFPVDAMLTEENLIARTVTDQNGFYAFAAGKEAAPPQKEILRFRRLNMSTQLEMGKRYQICFENSHPGNGRDGARPRRGVVRLECNEVALSSLQRCDYERDDFAVEVTGKVVCVNEINE